MSGTLGATSRTQERWKTGDVWCALAGAVSLALAAGAASTVAVPVNNGLGLFAVLPYSFCAGVLILNVAFVVALQADAAGPARRRIMMWAAVVLVAVLFGAAAFVTDVPPGEAAFRQLGIADTLSRTQSVEPDIGGYINWPGLFAPHRAQGPMRPNRHRIAHAPQFSLLNVGLLSRSRPVDDVLDPLPSTNTETFGTGTGTGTGHAARWWLLSDVHLGKSYDDTRCPGRAMSDFLRREVLAAPGPQHVAFVGDTFELVGFAEDESRARLEAILARHPDAFCALEACAARGVQLHFVCGNHDVELARPAVAARLSALLSPVEPARVRVYPWFLHVPRVLVAEHGHQHHALHRIPEVLRAADSGTDGLDLPPLAAWNADPSRSRLSRAAAVIRACLASERAERRVRTLAYEQLLQAESLRLALEWVAVRDLARLSRFRTLSALPVAATRMVLSAAGRRAAGERTPAAAGRFAKTLEEHGAGVAWYVSGHTHRALESALEVCPTRYVNTGTWSSDVRGHGPDQSDRGTFPYAVIDVARDGTTSGGLRYWRPVGA
jgi:UDP-2,3-diacylglucosamine pyrophosphatase LpxH